MIVMAASNDLITIFLGLELMSLALYVLVASGTGSSSRTRRPSSTSCSRVRERFLLYGIALLYGATGTTQIAKMASSSRSRRCAATRWLVAARCWC